MIQNYLLGGLTTSNSINSWLNGYQADFFDEIMEGDFYQGNDKDLIKKITPIINLNNNEITNSEIRIDTGAMDQERICRVR